MGLFLMFENKILTISDYLLSLVLFKQYVNNPYHIQYKPLFLSNI